MEVYPVSSPVPSPCRKICQLEANDICVGCGRHRLEIAAWTSLSEAMKQEVVHRAQQRVGRIKHSADPAN